MLDIQTGPWRREIRGTSEKETKLIYIQRIRSMSPSPLYMIRKYPYNLQQWQGLWIGLLRQPTYSMDATHCWDISSIFCLVCKGESRKVSTADKKAQWSFVAIQLITVTMEWECRQPVWAVKAEIWMLITASIHSTQLIQDNMYNTFIQHKMDLTLVQK